MSNAITVKNVSKTFRKWTNSPTSFKSVLVQAARGKLSFGQEQTFSALRNISFEVKKGEFLGIMGRNGAGKSTLLKLISGIYSPTSGSIEVAGVIAPLIELGAGFHPDLSGEENIFLNGAILGFGRKAVTEAFPRIQEFSELGEFLSMPVRNYSSGMTVRLGFSIAVHLDAPILLLDEMLAVGDAGFQRKCLNKINELHRLGRTIIFITHDSSAIQAHCSRCIIVENQEKVFDGPAAEGAALYEKLVQV